MKIKKYLAEVPPEHLPRVISVPFPLRFLFASQPAIMGKALGIIYRIIATHISKKVGHTKTPFPDPQWYGALRIKDTVSRWHHSHHLYPGLPALHPSGQPSAVQNRSRRFCEPLDFISKLAALVQKPRF